MNVDKWIDYYIKEAADDENKTRRIARIAAWNNLRAKISHISKLTQRDINNLDVTDYMRDKLKHMIKNKPPSNTLLSELSNIHGLGISKAKALIKKGVKCVNDLKHEPYFSQLSEETRLWLTHDITDKIPRDVITKFKPKLAKLLKRYKWDIAGSYRRGNLHSRDIDIIISHPGAISDIIEDLKPLNLIIYMRGDDKFAGIIKHLGNQYIKLDVMKTNDLEYVPFMLYITGSKDHNITMRKAAKNQGLLLNQHGLFKGSSRINVKTEHDIYAALKLPYRDPKNRKS